MVHKHLEPMEADVHAHAGSDTLALDRKLVNLSHAYCANSAKLAIHGHMLCMFLSLWTASRSR